MTAGKPSLLGACRAALRWEHAPQARGYRVDFSVQTKFPCLARINSIQLDFTMDYSAHSIIWTLFIGLIVGAIAKLLMPGKDPGGCIITILLGIAGALVGTWIGRIFAGGNYVAGWIMSVVGAMILLLLYRFLFKRGA
jgi:uncharacterized membrane protein YeaQ/YmgE (transglycosylase-associated protein family)